MKKNIAGILVAFQLLLIFLILFTAPWFNGLNLWLILQVMGMVLVVWAVYEIKIGNFNIRPIVKKDGILVTSGPYYFVRHPMYLATLMVMIALIGEYFSYIRLVFLLALLLVLILKIEFEEKELKANFSEYSEYILKTKRIFPFIY